MQNNINNLLESYIKFIYSTSEYNIITNRLKEFTKIHGNSAIVDYYFLQLKVVDKSVYKNEIIPYLKENKLNKFIEEKVNNDIVHALIESGDLNEEFVINNIEKEKTVLDIKMANFKDSVCLFKENLIKQVESLDLTTCIKKRESLRYQIDEYRYNYYKFAKQAKDFLLDNRIYQYRFQYGDDIGILKVKTIERIYTKSFIDSLKLSNPEILDYSVNSPALLKSKSKKIDRDAVNQFKIIDYKEYLYIKILMGLFNKRVRNKK